MVLKFQESSVKIKSVTNNFDALHDTVSWIRIKSVTLSYTTQFSMFDSGTGKPSTGYWSVRTGL